MFICLMHFPLETQVWGHIRLLEIEGFLYVKSGTWSAIFARISLIAKWLFELSGNLANSQNLAISEMVLGNFAISEIISLIASFFVPEVQKMRFLMFYLNSKQPNAPQSSRMHKNKGKWTAWQYKHVSCINWHKKGH